MFIGYIIIFNDNVTCYIYKIKMANMLGINSVWIIKVSCCKYVCVCSKSYICCRF